MTLHIHLVESGLFVGASLLAGVRHFQHDAPFHLVQNQMFEVQLIFLSSTSMIGMDFYDYMRLKITMRMAFNQNVLY